MKPLAFDLFCGAGGAGKGLADAGFYVVGVDKEPQPNYPFQFIQMNVLDVPVEALRMAALVWASPPCQFATAMKTMHNAKEHTNLIPATRALLQRAGAPYIIENVEGARAHLQNPIMLCGTMFGLGVGDAELRRHRMFETSFPVEAPQCRHGLKPDTLGIYGGHVRNRRRRGGSKDRGVADFTPDQGRQAMGVSWMTLQELSQAIPPTYSNFLAGQFLQWTAQTTARAT